MMINLKNYTNLTKIKQNYEYSLYRGKMRHSSQRVILKRFARNTLSDSDLTLLKRQYQYIQKLDPPYVAKIYDLIEESDSTQPECIVVYEEISGIMLKTYLGAPPVLPEKFLEIAISMATAINAIHKIGISHQGLRTGDFLYIPQTKIVKLVDPEPLLRTRSPISALSNDEFKDTGVIRNILPYISPEQTERMSWAIDYRSDLYALGVVYYELLTGTPPFLSDEPFEIIHAHIARQPIPIIEIQPDMPRQISEIIMRLLEKNPDARFQSVYGLRRDLENCLHQIKATGTIKTFIVAQKDVSEVFHQSRRIYGREEEIKKLLNGLDRVKNGQSHFTMVAGYAGIGKSCLVFELQKPLAEAGGFFISGKYDQYHKEVPYSAIIQAFQEMVNLILMESQDQIAIWKENLENAVDNNGQLIIEVIPEVEFIIGKQPPVIMLSPEEAQNRFRLVFLNFIKAFSQKGHPLALFLDDLQWADSASLQLIGLLAEFDIQDFYFLGAYRNNEMDGNPQLVKTLKIIQKRGGPSEIVLLKPITETDVCHLLADIFNQNLDAVSAPSQEIFAKTGGNPFFINQFLELLHAENIFSYDFDEGIWKWEMDKIQAQDITDNIVDLLSQRMRKLDSAVQGALQIAACLGDKFDINIIAHVSKKDLNEIAATLWDAQKSGFIVAVGQTSPYMPAPFLLTRQDRKGGLNDIHKMSFKFIHDRIRQAIYSQMPDQQKQETHLKIGQALMAATPAGKIEEHIFDIVKQLNSGIQQLGHPEELHALAQANLTAGKKAKATAAYDSAYNYLEIGISLLTPDSWAKSYDLSLELYEEGAEAAYLSGRFGDMAQLTQVVLSQAHSLPDKINVYRVRILALKAQNQLPEALSLGLSILRELKFKIPDKPNKFNVLKALMTTRLRLAGKQIEDFIHLPQMTDPYKLAVIRIGSTVASSAYYSIPELLPLIISKAINLSVKYGNAPEFTFIYAGYGFILCAFLGDMDAGYRFGNLALSALERFKAEKFKARTLFIVNAFIKHWKVHARQTLAPLEEAYKIGLKTGDLEYAAISAQIYPEYLFFVGEGLLGIEQELKALEKSINQIKQETNLNHNRICRQTILNLMYGAHEAGAPPWILAGEAYNERQMAPIHLQANDRSALSLLYNFKIILSVMFQAYPQAVDYAEIAENYIDNAAGLMNVPLFYFYESIARLAVFRYVSDTVQKDILKKVALNQKKLKKWAHHAPMNYLNKYYLVEAEREGIKENGAQALIYYDKAITLAKVNDYIHEEALAYELTAKYYLSQKMQNIGAVFFNAACQRYSYWGANAVVDSLRQKYAELSIGSAPPKTVDSKPLHLDSLTVIDSLQAISTEIVLDSLLKNLMKILMETAGASRIVFLSIYQRQILVEAEIKAEKADVAIFNANKLEAFTDFVPTPILNYVWRTSKYKVIENVENETAFSSDPYFLGNRPKSILCLPVLKQSRLTAILYFENSVATGAFTPDRIEILQLLSSQIAISFENARLYDNLCRLEGELSKRLNREQIIAAISSSFINLTPQKIDNGIDLALQKIGEFSNEDRCFIFQISADGQYVDETNVWCSPDVESLVDYFQRMPLTAYPWLNQKLADNQIVQVERLDDLPSEGARLKSFLEQQKLCSFLMVPMIYAGNLIGFLGCSAVFKEKKWDRDAIQLMRTVSEILASACARKRNEVDLQAYQQQLRSLSSELVLAEERERRRIAIELHDHIGHTLANAMIKLGSVRKAVRSVDLTGQLEEINALLDESIKDTRSLTFDLSPHILYDMGLEAAVDWLVEKMREEHDIFFEFEDDLQPKPLDDSHRILIYQAIRELLFNIVKHARARYAKVAITRHERQIRIVVEDDGVGIDLEKSNPYGTKSGGFGLFSIRERLNSQDGSFEIASKPGRGTRIIMVFPIKKSVAE